MGLWAEKFASTPPATHGWVQLLCGAHPKGRGSQLVSAAAAEMCQSDDAGQCHEFLIVGAAQISSLSLMEPSDIASA